MTSQHHDPQPTAEQVLEPCPFCGGDGKLFERHNPMSKWRHSVDCTSTTCGASGPVEASKAEAIVAWNTRANAWAKAADRLREALRSADACLRRPGPADYRILEAVAYTCVGLAALRPQPASEDMSKAFEQVGWEAVAQIARDRGDQSTAEEATRNADALRNQAASASAGEPVETKRGEWKRDCETCEGEGKLEHPHMPVHSLQSEAPEYAVVDCEDCDGAGWNLTDEPVSLADCPIGLFWHGDTLCLKTEYGNNEGRIDAYIVSSGEFFWGHAPQTITEQRSSMVQPIDTDFAETALYAHPAPLASAGEVERLREALGKCRNQFAFYAAEHKAKAEAAHKEWDDACYWGNVAEQGAKQAEYLKRAKQFETNEQFVALCDAALSAQEDRGDEALQGERGRG